MTSQSDSDRSQTWFMLPARGGSKGVPRKVLRDLGGKPLIRHLLEALAVHVPQERVVVSTDSDEIAQVCQGLAIIHPRPAELAEDRSTLDEVAVAVARWLQERGAKADDLLITLQPTSPFLRYATIERGIDMLQSGHESVLTVRRDPHLRWSLDEAGLPVPLYKARVNRQWATPCFVETGGLIAARIGRIVASGTRIQAPTALLELDEKEGLDIDTHADWAMAEFYARRRRIVIRGDAGTKLGMGHVHRMAALASELASNELLLVTRRDAPHELGAQFLSALPYKVEAIDAEEGFFAALERERPHIVILDVLDTSEEYVERVRKCGGFIVTLEDLGAGARHADLVINDLYTDFLPQQNHWYGLQYAMVNPVFETVAPREAVRDRVQKVVVSFGGTDPNNLTIKALAALSSVKFSGETVVVLGPGYAHTAFELKDFGLRGELHRNVKNMALLTCDADIAITAAGRTVTELMTVGVPMIAMCQNMNELRHTHASSPFGVINLGLGQHVDPTTLAEYIQMLIADKRLRADMRMRGLQAVHDRSNRKIALGILEVAARNAAPMDKP